MEAHKKRMLITGISGLLGNNLAFCLKDKYDILGLYNTHEVKIDGIKTQKTDILFEDTVGKVIKGFGPQVVIHCAALSSVDFCEDHEKLAHQVNVLGTKNIVDQTKDYNTKLIYISSDMVYDDIKERPLEEEDRIKPPNCYGLTKYKGEQEALKKHDTLIIRTNFFGWNIQNKLGLAEWIIHELSCGNEIKGFDDVYFSSIYTFELAQILDRAIDKDLKGIYNCGSKTAMSKYEFALQIADYFELNKSLIEPISVDQFSLKAKRKKNLTLDVRKISRDLNCNLPTMEESIKKFHKDFKKGIRFNFSAVA